MSILNPAQTTPLVGFNSRFSYLGDSDVNFSMRRLLGRNEVSPEMVEAARNAVNSGFHSSSVNMLWAQHSESPMARELRFVPYISSLMWARILAATNAPEADIIEVLNMRGLPAYWGLATTIHCEGVVRQQTNRVEYIRSLAEYDNYSAFNDQLHNRRGNPETRSRRVTVPDSTPAAPATPARIATSPYIFEWTDTQAPIGTKLTVSRWGCVCYQYGGSYSDSGTKDIGAVRRAVRQWKKWEKPQGLQLFCHPARPRLAEFYRLFPEVEIR